MHLPTLRRVLALAGGIIAFLPNGILGQSCAKCDEVAHGFASLNGGTSGGKGGQIVTVKKYSDLIKYAADPEPLIIRVDGILKASPKGFEVPVFSNKTIIGVGKKSGIDGGGFNIKNQQNIIIRNLAISGTYDPKDYPGKLNDFDALQVDRSKNIWVDYCHFSQMEDGLIDLRTDSDFITVSRTILSKHNKAFGIGWTQNVVAKVTINDCFFESTNTRGPSADNLQYGHFYNNYWRNITQYGLYSRGKSSILVENSYFENAHDPIVAGPLASIKSNWLKFKNCTGERILNQNEGSVFKASDFYSYTLRDPYDIPIDIPYFGGPQETIGV